MTEKRIAEIIAGFKNKKILVIGDAMLDHYVKGKVERLNPEAPVPVLHTHEEWFATGGAGNTAKNLSALGAKTFLIGVTGVDQYSEAFKKKSQDEGYEVSLVSDNKRPTTRKVRFLVNSQQLLRVDYEKNENIDESAEKEILLRAKNAMKGSDGVIISDYAKGVVTEKVAKKIIKEAVKMKIPVSCDVKVSRAPFVTNASFISPNLKEGYEFLGLNKFEQNFSAAEIARRLKKKLKTNVFLTLGREGIYVSAQDGTDEYVPQKNKVDVFDESGAGDTTMAVMMLAILCGANNIEAAELGNAGGAAVVQKIGSVAISPKELEIMAIQHHN